MGYVRISVQAQTRNVIARAIVENLHYIRGRTPAHATTNDWYTAVARTVGDRLLDRWVKTLTTQRRQPKIVSYFSAEFLLGPHLGNAMLSLGIFEQVTEAVNKLGFDLDKLSITSRSLASGMAVSADWPHVSSIHSLLSGFPAIGYGIRYEFGIFDQEIRDGWQKEISDNWLALGNPWEICPPRNHLLRALRGSYRIL